MINGIQIDYVTTGSSGDWRAIIISVTVDSVYSAVSTTKPLRDFTRFSRLHKYWIYVALAYRHVHPVHICSQGHSQRGKGVMSPNRRLSGFFYGKNWLCWDVGPTVLIRFCTLFSKVTLFYLPEVFCGPQICQNALAAGDPAGELTTLPDP